MLKWTVVLVVLAASVGVHTSSLNGADSELSEELHLVAEIERAYRKGEYDDFLKLVHSQYESAGKAGILRQLFENAKKAADPKDQSTPKLTRGQLARIDKERNQKLLQAIAKHPELAIAKRVDTVVFSSMTDKQEDLLESLESLRFDIPKTAQATIENKISALETEYYMKSLLLEVGRHTSREQARDLPKKKILLQIAKLDKMLGAANELGEKKWVKKVEKMAAAYRVKQSFSVDYEGLKHLAHGRSEPKNPVEEKVKRIMMEYLQQREETLSQIVKN